MPFEKIRCYDVTDSSFASGAAGDGTANDAAAIQAAINAIVTDYGTNGYDSSTTPATGAYLRSVPVLYFPPGRYKIGQTISFPQGLSALTVLGDNAIILPHSSFPNTDFASADWAFEVRQSYRFKIEGLSFLAFKKAVSIDTNNIDTSQLNITSCAFQDGDLALQLAGTSSISVIEKSKFYNNIQAIKILGGDKVTVKDNWITSGNMPALDPEEYPAQYDNYRPCQIENRAVLHFAGNLLVPLPPVEGAIEPAWINNYGYVKVEDTRQGGESGSFTLINNFAVTADLVSNSPAHTAVIVKDSACYAVYGNVERSPSGFTYLQPAVVRFIKIPNLTVVKNNVGLVNCKLMDYSLHQYADALDPYIFDPAAIVTMIADSNAMEGLTVIEAANNSGPYLLPQGAGYPQTPQVSYVPELLYPFVRTNESLWPHRRQPFLPKTATTLVGSVSTFEFDISSNFLGGMKDKTFLLRFSGDPLVAGGGLYSGGIVGVLKVNGTYVSSAIQFALVYEDLFNQIATPGTFLSGTFGVAVKWKTTGTDLLPYTSTTQTDQQFVVEVTGADARVNLDLIILNDL